MMAKWLEDQCQRPPFSILAERIPRCTFGDSSSNPLQVENGQNDLEGHGQWPPFSIPAESVLGCIFGANLVILAYNCDELSCGQAEFPRILSQNCQNDLEDQGQWPPFSIPVEGIPGCMFGANLAIPAQTCDELSCGQGKVYGRTDKQTDGRTDRRTDAGNENTPSAWKAKE